MSYGIVTIDLARVLSEARRTELSHELHARPSPHRGVRGAIGRSLVRTGLRLLGTPLDRPAHSGI